MASTVRIENPKDFEKELAQIKLFNQLSEFSIQVVGHEELPTRISRKENTFYLHMGDRWEDEDDTKELSFYLNDTLYEIKKLHYTSGYANLSEDFPAEFSTTYEAKTIQSQSFDFDTKGNFKSFYPVDISELKTFHWEFETVTYQRGDREYFYDCIRIEVEGTTYDILQIKEETEGCYVFECVTEESFKKYTEVCYAIRQAIGFINKLMVGGEEYIFDGLGNLYYSNYIRPTIKGMYQPVTANPYSHLDVDRNFADEIFYKLTRVAPQNLATLSNRIYKDEDFSVAIVIVLEATSIHSLLLIPSSFAVVIELLSKALSVEETGLEVPIQDNELKKKVISELMDVIDNNSTSMSSHAVIKLKNRLTGINQPINKERLTNNEKLIRPFFQLGIDLTLNDIEIIEHRNDLLHGNVLLKNEDRQNEDSQNLYMGYVSAKLFTLISKLVLKSVGYNGYVYNQAKYLEKHLEIETEDAFFEKI